MRDYQNVHELWVNAFFSLEDWERYIVFGLTFKGMGGPILPIKNKIKNVEKFRAQLGSLCLKFQFDINSPAILEKTDIINPGKLGHSVANELLKLNKCLDDYKRDLESELVRTARENKKFPPRPFRFPPFFSFYILVGISLHRESTQALELLRVFLSSNGRLKEWLRSKGASEETIRKLIRNVGGSEDVRSWVSQEKQTMEESAVGFSKFSNIKILRKLVLQEAKRISEFKTTRS